MFEPIKPPMIMLEHLAQERLIDRYQNMLQSWSLVLISMAQHAGDIEKGRGIKAIPGGFKLPYNWQVDIPTECDLNVIEDEEDKSIVVRVLGPSARIRKPDDSGWIVHDEEKRAEDAQGELDAKGEA